jgi:hypothetical protein
MCVLESPGKLVTTQISVQILEHSFLENTLDGNADVPWSTVLQA